MTTKNKFKLEVSKWFLESTIPFLGKCIELLFRIMLFILPLGIYLILIQNRNKVSKISNISVFTKDESVWQHVFPGFILVSIDPNSFKKQIQEIKRNVQNKIASNKYLIEVIFMVLALILMYLIGVK